MKLIERNVKHEFEKILKEITNNTSNGQHKKLTNGFPLLRFPLVPHLLKHRRHVVDANHHARALVQLGRLKTLLLGCLCLVV